MIFDYRKDWKRIGVSASLAFAMIAGCGVSAFAAGLKDASCGKRECACGETDAHKFAGNLRSYPFMNEEPPSGTPAPEGYVPFHMEHYSRHGSRWLIGEGDYTNLWRNLRPRSATAS